jgi:hypothetical protein
MEYKFFANTISPRYEKLKLSELITYNGITAEVEHIFKNNIVKLKLDKKIAREDLDYLTSRLMLLKPEQFTTEYDLSVAAPSISNDEKDLSGIDMKMAIQEFITMLDVDKKEDILNMTLGFYNSVSK